MGEGDNTFSGVGAFLLGAGILINAMVSVYTAFEASNTKEAVVEQIETIKTLEKNTNSIKDALVKVTGESERAKGVLEGERRLQQDTKPK